MNAGSQTTLTTFTPSYNGYVYVTGSSSAAIIIRIHNNTSSTDADYSFTTGTTVTAAVTAGNTYSVIARNTSGAAITATLSGTYYHY